MKPKFNGKEDKHMENILYLNRSGLEADIKKMRNGLEAFQSAVKEINAGVDAAPEDWKGATSGSL